MNLYIVSSEKWDWDEYDSHVVAANTDSEAFTVVDKSEKRLLGDISAWTSLLIGTSVETIPTIVHSSFVRG